MNGPKENDENEDDLAELPPLLRDLFDWLLDHHEVESSGARWKVCLLVNRLLKLLGEEAEIDDELYQKIYDNMLERLKDKGQLISKCPFGPSNLQENTMKFLPYPLKIS